MATNYPINPRVRAYGKARLDIAGRATSLAQWEKLWKHPANSFPFVWGDAWKQCIEYRVDDFAAEVGFFTDILGLPVNALDPGYAMFTSPRGDFFFSVVPTAHAEQATPPDAFRLQFMVQDILATTLLLQQRGIDFEQTPQPLQPGSSLSIASFRTPHGLCVELWGKMLSENLPDAKMDTAPVMQIGEDADDDDEDDLDEDEEDDEPISEPDGNGSDGEDAEEDDLSIDKDEAEDDDFEFDEEEDDLDADEDDDDDDGDEDVALLKSEPRKSDATKSIPQPVELKAKLPDKSAGMQNAQAPEYIDLDLP